MFLSSVLSMMLPVAFFHGADELAAVVVTKDEKRLIDRLVDGDAGRGRR